MKKGKRYAELRLLGCLQAAERQGYPYQATLGSMGRHEEQGDHG